MSFIDLKIFPRLCQSPPSPREEAVDAFRKNDLCPVDGFCPHLRVPKVRRAIQRQLQGQELHLLGSISMHGLRPTDLPGKSAGHPSLSTGSPIPALSPGHQGKGVPQHPGSRQSSPGCEDFCRFRFPPDRQGKNPLCNRFFQHRTGSSGLRPGFDHHQSLPDPVSLGRVPETQGRRQTAHPSGSPGQHPFRRHRDGGEGSRRQHPRRSDPRAGGYLRYGSGLSGFQPASPDPADTGLLRDPGESQLQPKAPLFPARRQDHRHSVRSDRCPHGIRREEKIPGKDSPDQILRCKERPYPRFPDQQLHPARPDHRRSLPESLASGTVLQVDQATPPDQDLLWHHRERRDDPDLDRHLRLCPGRHRSQDPENRSESLHNSTDFECHPLRENPHLSGTFKYRLHPRRHRYQQPAEFVRLTLGQ